MADEITVQLVRERETKNTVRYAEVEGEDAQVLGVLYVQKHAVRRLGSPERVEVRIRKA
jgi:hypothetical protein